MPPEESVASEAPLMGKGEPESGVRIPVFGSMLYPVTKEFIA
jgi:hypothetical protein